MGAGLLVAAQGEAIPAEMCLVLGLGVRGLNWGEGGRVASPGELLWGLVISLRRACMARVTETVSW